MKCELVRDDSECIDANPDLEQTIVKVVKQNGKLVKRRFWKRGAIIDHPKAYRLVQMGVAVPADQECKDEAGLTPEEIRLACKAADRLQNGILPEDYDLFDRGVITGYNPDGSYKPGPNWHEMEEVEQEEEDVNNDVISDEE